MIFGLSEPLAVALVGLVGGIGLGLAARLGRFCTLGAIEDVLYGGSGERLRMWGVAIAVGIIATHALMAAGLVVPADTVYLSFTVTPLAAVLGGLVFGYGMALAGNCGFGALARLGGGDLRSFVIVLVMGVASFVTISGPLARLRVTLFPNLPAADLPSIPAAVSQLTGLNMAMVGLGIGVVALAALVLRGARAKTLAWGALVGLSVASGWAGTQYVAANGFETLPVVSHTFSRPLGEAMIWLMTSSARPLSFGVGSVAGVLAGAFIGSLWLGHFRWEACEDPRELRRQITGAALMGVGAVVAFGCTVGQGISAFSLLAFSAPLVFVSIFAGAALGLRQLIGGLALR
ncbi:YeeE/YedE family protein [Aliiroseovarius sp. PTFE2010]|uniref:YeeE/YedE family protein n=1 Tax=Aliiroseovarius sp. PTFE2010 TaxID=3417190 RepID=UPI003CF7E6BA